MARRAVTCKMILVGTWFATSAALVSQIPLSEGGMAFAFVAEGSF